MPEANEPDVKLEIEPTKMAWWSDNVRAVPNSILRSALFSIVKKGERKSFFREPVFSANSITIIFTGQQLDQSDLDVWAQILHFSKHSCGNNEVEFIGTHISAPDLLRAMGKMTGGSDVKWLIASMTRLQSAVVEIKYEKHAFSGHLIHNIERNDKTKKYVIDINPKLAGLFGNTGFTRIELDERNKLKGKPLEKWLHGFYSSHQNTDTFHYSVVKIMELCGSRSEHIRGFKQELSNSLEVLSSLTGWECYIDSEVLVHVIKDESVITG